MKPVCCDTSFLFSIYGADNHTRKAMEAIASVRLPISLSVLNVFELENALRCAEFRSVNSPPEVGNSLAAFDRDCREGRVSIAPVNLTLVIETARRLSRSRTTDGGHRAFDVLHVAAALCLKAERFFSFDVSQRRLAESEGLKLNP